MIYVHEKGERVLAYKRRFYKNENGSRNLLLVAPLTTYT